MRIGSKVKALAATLASAAIALNGCGSSSSGTDADPATLVPASTPVYLSVTLRPAGGSGGQAVTAARKLTHLSDPYGSLAQSLLSSEGSHPQWPRELKPWVGRRAGVFFSSIDTSKLPQASNPGLIGMLLSGVSAGAFGTGAAQGAIVLDTSDLGKARSFLDAQAHAHGAHGASYRGVSYQLWPNGIAEGLVRRFAVVGSESGLKATIDASLGAGALAATSDYGKPSAQAISTAFLAPQRLNAAVHGSAANAGAGVTLLGQLFAGAQSASLSVTPASDSLQAEGEVRYGAGATPLFGQGAAQTLGGLPGGAWLAAGVGDVGAELPRALALLRSTVSLAASTVFSSLGGPGLESLARQLSAQAGALQRDFARWAGPAGVFVSGTGLFNLQAALVIGSHDPTASHAEVGRLARLLARGGALVSSVAIPGTDAAATVKLTGFPAVLYIADGAGADGQARFVVGLGQASIVGALHPASTLSTSPSYSAASRALGGGVSPSAILEFPTLLGFLEAIGLAQNPPLSELAPYLKSLGTLTAGSTTQGRLTRFRAVLGLSGGSD